MGENSMLGRTFAPSKLLFYLVFHGLHVVLFVVGWYVQITDDRLAALNTLTFSVWMSRGAGLVLSVDTTLLLLPMCRNIMTWLRPKFRWLPLDETVYFHRNVAYAMLFWTAVHTAAHYVNFFNVERSQVRPEAAVEIHYSQAGGITGHIMLLCMLLMYTTSHKNIRQQSHEAFYYTHFLFIPFFLAMYTHATGCFVRDSVQPFSPFAGHDFWAHCIGYEGWRWELVAGGLYLCERVYREWRIRRTTHIVSVIKHPYDAVEIKFVKPSMKYRAGQWLFLNCPEVARNQWHPFTITSCPHDSFISVHMRQVGDWTRDMADALGAGPTQAKIYEELDPHGIYEIFTGDGEELPAIRVDGPYGAPAEDVFENEVAILIGTGIGVTPWAAILKDIWHQRTSANPPRRLKRVEFVWITKDTKSFEWFQQLLSSLEEQSRDLALAQGSSQEFLRIHTYLTQKLDIDTANNIVLNSVGMEKDPLTQLDSRTNFGRPDFTKLFAGVRDGILNQSYLKDINLNARSDVGVYFCGPNVVARDIKAACKGANGDKVRFNFWKEHY